MHDIQFATAASVKASSTVKRATASWDRVAAYLTKPRTYGSKLDAPLFFAATFGGEGPTAVRKDNLTARTLLAFDLDDGAISVDTLKELLMLNVPGCYAAYSTYSHCAEHPKFRIFLPIERPLTPAEYPVFSRQVAEELGILAHCDPCSFTPSEGMFVRSTSSEGEHDSWGASNCEGGYWPVPDVIAGATATSERVIADLGVSDDMGGLSEALAQQPKDFSDAAVAAMLEEYPSVGLPYDRWLEVGQALHHQYSGSDAGFNIWMTWSARNTEKHDPHSMKMRWGSFGGRARPVTLATLKMRLGETHTALVVAETRSAGIDEALAKITQQAKSMSLPSDEVAFREDLGKFRKIATKLFPNDIEKIAQGVAQSLFGLDSGYGIVQARKEVNFILGLAMPKGSKKVHEDLTHAAPEWCAPWMYVSSRAQYYNHHTQVFITKQAFDTQFAAQKEVLVEDGPTASLIVSQRQWIQIVADVGFNPVAGLLYNSLEGAPVITGESGNTSREVKTWVNTFQGFSAVPAEPAFMNSTIAKEVVGRFRAHLHLMIGNEREERLVMDWMAWSIQHPGNRINWMLLIQGPTGAGKTYLFDVLRHIMGTYARVLSEKVILSSFTTWGEGALVNCIEEVRDNRDRYEMIHTLLTYITNDYVSIHQKGRDEKSVRNFTNYLGFTNYTDALPLTEADRRYCAIFSRWTNEAAMIEALGQHLGREGVAFPEGKPNEVYFSRLFSDLRDHGSVLYRMFLDHEVSAEFSPTGRAPITAARQSMIDDAIPQYVHDLENWVDDYGCDIVSEQIIDIGHLRNKVVASHLKFLPDRLIKKAMIQLKYTPLSDTRQVKICGKMRTVYVKGISKEDALKVCKDFYLIGV